MTAPFGWGQAVGGGQTAQEDGTHGHPAHDRPGQEQRHAGLGEGGHDQGQRTALGIRELEGQAGQEALAELAAA